MIFIFSHHENSLPATAPIRMADINNKINATRAEDDVVKTLRICDNNMNTNG
jgi:hypothetical protein